MPISPDHLTLTRSLYLNAPPQTPPDAATGNFWGSDGLTFGDLLDAINPLQHIPIVSTLYRAATDDEISAGARIVGGGVFGGPFGLAAAVFNAVLAETSGKDMGEHVIAAISSPAATEGEDAPASPPPAFTVASDAIGSGRERWESPWFDADRRAPVIAANRATGRVPPDEDPLDQARAWLAAKIDKKPAAEIAVAAAPARHASAQATEPPARRPSQAPGVRIALAAYHAGPDDADSMIMRMSMNA